MSDGWSDETQMQINAYQCAHRTYPNIDNPTTFNEKILYRRLFDRRPILSTLSDRIAMRDYVQARLGSDVLPTVYCRTTNPETICFDRLPDQFVVKPTHLSGFAKVVTDKRSLDVDRLVQKCFRALKCVAWSNGPEWASRDILPEILVEEFIDDGSGAAPLDYKVFVFDGVARMVQVDKRTTTFDKTRSAVHQRRLYTPTWERVNARFGTQLRDIVGHVAKPPHLNDMIAAAQKLGAGLDFIRADFYDTARRFYFGEFAVYPDAGLYQFDPTSFDLTLGEYWEIRS